METYAKQFRSNKKLSYFIYDRQKIDTITNHLIDYYDFDLETVAQDAVSFFNVVEMARNVAETKRIFWNIDDFMKMVKNMSHFYRDDGIITEDESEIEKIIKKIEISIRIIECCECFDARKYLSSFVSTHDEEFKLKTILRSVGYP